MRGWKKSVSRVCRDIVMELADMPAVFWLTMLIFLLLMGGLTAVSCSIRIDPTAPASEAARTSTDVIQDTTERIEKLSKTIDTLAATIDALNVVMDKDGATEKNLADLDAATKKLEQSIEVLREPIKGAP